MCFEGLQWLEGCGNVGLGSHLGQIDLECDEAAEDDREVGLSVMKTFRVGWHVVGAVAYNVKG